MNNKNVFDHILNHPTGIDGVTYNQFVLGLFRPMEQAAMFTHAVLGVVSEYHEATTARDETNLIEELGDYLFFMVAMLQQLPDSAGFGTLTEFQARLVQLVTEAADAMPLDNYDLSHVEASQYVLTPLLDLAKRWLAYDKAPTEEQAKDAALRALVGFGLIHSKAGGVSEMGSMATLAERIIKANVAKLKHRYKGGFSTEAAINRDLEGEVDALRSAQPV